MRQNSIKLIDNRLELNVLQKVQLKFNFNQMQPFQSTSNL
jgi:hypothetical protein